MLISQPASTLATNKGLDTNIIEVVSSSDLTQGEKVEIKTVDKFNNEVIIGIEEVVEPKGVISECNTKNAGSTYCWLKATPTGSDNNISVTYN